MDIDASWNGVSGFPDFVQTLVFAEGVRTDQTPVLQDKAECASAGQVFNDLGLSREALTVLLDLLRSATIQTLVFLFCLASGASYRVVSRVFDMPCSTVHRIVLRVADEVLAIHQEIHLPKTPEHLEAGLGSKLMLFF